MEQKKFTSDVWGPNYWFFMHTLAYSYPNAPNAVTKRKYYDLIQNMPLFIPIPEMGNNFSRLLDKYPVTPYLDSRESFIRWINFIHNKVNLQLGKPEISLYESIEKYYMNYLPKQIEMKETMHIRKHYIYYAIILVLFIIIYILYKR